MFTVSPEDTKSRQEKSLRYKFYETLLSATLLCLICSQRYAGFLLLIFTPFLLVWLLFSLYIVYKKPELKKWQLGRIGIWITCILIVLGMHKYYEINARKNANDVIDLIERYRSEHGNYPKNYMDIGMDQQKLRDKCGIFCFFSHEKEAQLTYAGTFIIHSFYTYDFNTKKWEFLDD